MQSLFGFLHRRLRALDINVFGLFSDLCHDRDFGGGDFGKTPKDRHVMPDIISLVSQFADPERR